MNWWKTGYKALRSFVIFLMAYSVTVMVYSWLGVSYTLTHVLTTGLFLLFIELVRDVYAHHPIFKK